MWQRECIGHVTNTYPVALDEDTNDVKPIRIAWPAMPVDPN